MQGDPCRTTTPSSGHFSAGSKVSSPSPPGQEGAGKLRRELESLRKRHSQEQRDWREERKGLVDQLVKKQRRLPGGGDLQESPDLAGGGEDKGGVGHAEEPEHDEHQ